MTTERSDRTMVDPTAVMDTTLGEIATVAAPRDVLVLAWSAASARGPEWLVLPRSGVELGREMTGFPHGPLADPRMSRRHLQLARAGGGWVARDLESRNGSRLDGERLHGEAPLKPGSVLRLGSSLFVLSRRQIGGGTVHEDPELVGSSGVMQELRRAIAAVAPHPNTVLITGETGTGKEVVASALHRASGRRGRLVAVNCGAVSEGVLESELFGHRKGAFTGAVSDKDGLFTAADGGTLFLDEVGEMPESLQVKLLRVLETRRVRPLGSTREHEVDVRVVAATNRDLVAEVRGGRFRSDVFARLNQWPIELPPLRSRREDIPELAHALLRRRGDGDRRLSMGLLEALMVHGWALNVRGLANVLGVAAIASPAGGDLELGPQVGALLDADAAMARVATPDHALLQTVPSVSPVRGPAPSPEGETLASALREANGSVAAAARALGVSRQQVYRAIEVEGWDLESFRRQ